MEKARILVVFLLFSQSIIGSSNLFSNISRSSINFSNRKVPVALKQWPRLARAGAWINANPIKKVVFLAITGIVSAHYGKKAIDQANVMFIDVCHEKGIFYSDIIIPWASQQIQKQQLRFQDGEIYVDAKYSSYKINEIPYHNTIDIKKPALLKPFENFQELRPDFNGRHLPLRNKDEKLSQKQVVEKIFDDFKNYFNSDGLNLYYLMMNDALLKNKAVILFNENNFVNKKLGQFVNSRDVRFGENIWGDLLTIAYRSVWNDFYLDLKKNRLKWLYKNLRIAKRRRFL